MTASVTPHYYPSLRLKLGELMGLRDLASDVADHVLPRLIVPPPMERDDQLQAKLFEATAFPDIGGALSGHWRRPVLIEGTYLMDEFGRDQMSLWYPRMFEHARKSGLAPIPLVTADDLLTEGGASYRDAVDHSSKIQMGIVISSSDLLDDEKLRRAIDEMGRVGVAPGDGVIIADFHDGDFSDPEVVAPIVSGAMETLHASAPWKQIVFQGTNFPEKNPALPGTSYVVPRNEWLAWKQAVVSDPDSSRVVFGDYAADSAKIDFGRKGGAAAIRHLRYTTMDGCLVQRGPDSGATSNVMRDVCQAIIKSGLFAGREFSSADDLIYRIAYGLVTGPGGGKEWRAINTTHHITRVMTDIGEFFGFRFVRKEIPKEAEQMSLLPY